MPIFRFSAVEHGGLLIPKSELKSTAKVGKLAALMLQHGVAPTALQPDDTIDVTPPYWTGHSHTYWVHTEAADPPESCTGLTMPRLQGASSFRMHPDGTFATEPLRSLRIPVDRPAYVIMSPDLNPVQPGLRLHEFIMPLPHQLAAGAVAVAEQYQAARVPA